MNEDKKRWAVVDCSKQPNEKNCKIKMMAPEAQVEDVVDLAVDHAVKVHGHQNSPDLRQKIKAAVEIKEF